GIGAMAMSGREHRGTLFSSDARAATMEDLQFSLGEGPCLDAYHGQRPVLVAELAEDRGWPAFTPAATDAGVAAIFAFPLQLRSARVGALNFYRDRPGALQGDDVLGAVALSEVAVRLGPASGADSPPGWLPGGLEEATHERRGVHQATGMVSVQLGLGTQEALAILRAHAWAEGRSLGEVADDVVARRLRFDP